MGRGEEKRKERRREGGGGTLHLRITDREEVKEGLRVGSGNIDV